MPTSEVEGAGLADLPERAPRRTHRGAEIIAATAPAGDDDEGDDAVGDEAGSPCPADVDVTAAVGVEVVAEPPAPDRCGYSSSDGVASVGIDVEDPTSRTLADVERNQPVEPVDGLGDDAYSIETPGGIVQLGVFGDGAHVLVTVQGFDGATVAAARAVYDLYGAA